MFCGSFFQIFGLKVVGGMVYVTQGSELLEAPALTCETHKFNYDRSDKG